MKTGTSLLIGLLVTGCAAQAPLYFSKDGEQPGDFEKAKYECTVQGDRSAGAIAYAQDPLSNLSYLSKARQDMIDCLAYKGWEPNYAEGSLRAPRP